MYATPGALLAVNGHLGALLNGIGANRRRNLIWPGLFHTIKRHCKITGRIVWHSFSSGSTIGSLIGHVGIWSLHRIPLHRTMHAQCRSGFIE